MTRRRAPEIEVSMFPFLSVLCAVIGILMLFMIVIISTRVMEAGLERPDGGHDPTRLTDLQQAGIDEQHYQAIQEQLQQLNVRLQQRRQKYRELHAAHLQLVDLIRAKQGGGLPPARRPTRLGQKDKVRVVPDRTRGIRLDPICVEVKAEGFVVYPEKRLHPLKELTQANSALREFIQDVDRENDTRYLLFLVRPNGVVAFDAVFKYVMETYRGRLRVGFEPIPTDWQVVEQPQDMTT